VSFSAAAGIAIAGVFVARAATGVPAAWAHRDGRKLEASSRFEEAGSRFDLGAVGADRVEALWRAGRARLETWDAMPFKKRSGPDGDGALRAAAERFLDGRADSPASGWFTAALAAVYADRESTRRLLRTTDLASLDKGPWALVGDDARVAIGLTRAAIEREPTRFELRDQLVLFLEANGLHDDALHAMEDAARVLPDFRAHAEFTFESLPRDLLEQFWRTARTVGPGEAPLLSREQLLLSAGQLGRRLGHLDEAERDIRAAMDMPGTRLGRAEDAFHLALVLVDEARFDDAEAQLALALLEPRFGPAVADTRARVAEKQGRWREALERLGDLRRFRPRDAETLLRYSWAARKAGAWDQAEESLRWAIVVDPNDPALRRVLCEMFIEKGDGRRARRALDDYVQTFGRTAETGQLEAALAAALDPARR
jgi:tetratricopeptide (TPR) repeat protein